MYSLRVSLPALMGLVLMDISGDVCEPLALYNWLRESIPNLHALGLGDKIGSVYCVSVS